MNRKQIIVIVVAAIAIAAAFLFPSWASLEFVDTDQGQILMTNYERRLFNNPPEHSDLKEPYIPWLYAVQEAVAYAAVAGILCYFLRSRKTRVIDDSHGSVPAAAAL